MTTTSPPGTLPPLPDRGGAVVGDLPDPFAPAQIDALPQSVCRCDGSWVVSTDAWEDRRLGRLDVGAGSTTWAPVASPAGWTRQPRSVDGHGLAALVHDRNADEGRLLVARGTAWDVVAERVAVGSVTDWDGRRPACRDAGGHAGALSAAGEVRVVAVGGGARLLLGTGGVGVGLPPGCTVTQLAVAPDGERIAVVVRRGSACQTRVFAVGTGRPEGAVFAEPVHSAPLWWGADRLLVVVERWPSLVPVAWSWATGDREELWPTGLIGTARSLAAAPDGDAVAAVTTPGRPRHLVPLDALAGLDDPAGDGVEVRTAVVTRGDQPLPCLVYEPPGPARGTVCYFPGGPHEPMWGEYSPFSRSLARVGWRVVRVNTRSSGLREAAYRPGHPIRYGVDDRLDALAVIDALGEGPVVTMGMSYGGYLATLAGEDSGRVRAIVVLSGFLSRDDLAGTRHPDVRRFITEAFTTTPDEPARLTRHVFVAHGSADPRVPIDAVRAHRARTGSFTFLELPRQGHAILSDHDARVTYPALLDWLDDLFPA